VVPSCLPTAVSLIYLLLFGYVTGSVSACGMLLCCDCRCSAGKGLQAVTRLSASPLPVRPSMFVCPTELLKNRRHVFTAGACHSGRRLPGGLGSPDRLRCGGAGIAVSKGYMREYEVVKRQNETAAGAVDKTRRASDLMTIGKGLIVVVGMVAAFCRRAIGLLAESATTAPADDPLSNAIRGGVMNHRTGKFDEGNDPAGWYEGD
jgi:hypothetical protein